MHKKLLFVITQGVVGGAQKNVFDLASSLKNNYDVSVAIGGEGNSDLANKLGEQKIKTHHLKFLGRDLNILDDFLAFFEILRLYKKEKPDIIHLHSSKVGLFGAIAGFVYKLGTKNKPKIIFTAHGWIFKEEMSSKMRVLTAIAARFAGMFQDKIVCVSKDDLDKALKYNVAPARKLFLVYNAIFHNNFLEKDEALKEVSDITNHVFSKDDFIITNLGRLYANKGLTYLIESIKDFKFIKLVIFGDGPEKENLKSQISNLKLEDVVFLAGDQSGVSKYLKAFDAMVLSSTKEGFPYSILEAGLAGVPVIATNVGGIGEIIKDGDTGVLIEAKNTKALEESILKIHSSKEFGQKISANLKKIIDKDFSFANMIEKIDWIYRT